jgi:hypothetical protein
MGAWRLFTGPPASDKRFFIVMTCSPSDADAEPVPEREVLQLE